jgi:hypothetical protein
MTKRLKRNKYTMHLLKKMKIEIHTPFIMKTIYIFRYKRKRAYKMSNVNIEENVGDCVVCIEELTESTTVVYQDKKDSDWKKCVYCDACVKSMLDTKWEIFMQSLKKIDCEPAFKRIVASGPPINLRDSALPCDNDAKEVYMFKCNGEVFSAKLKESYIGEKRDALCKHLDEMLTYLKLFADKST